MAFEALIRQYGDMAWRIALSHERNTAIAEELYQEICFALWQARERIAEADSPRAFVARIAMNQAVSHVRREVRQPDVVADADTDTRAGDAGVDDAIDRFEQQQQLLAAVQDLPLNWRLPVTLTLEGFKPQEIAYVMGTSPNTISMRLSRAKKTLRERMADAPNENGELHEA
ncbi:MAG: sigma-70 family RNA polymerase sigma factor [Pseudomonadota bacterium]